MQLVVNKRRSQDPDAQREHCAGPGEEKAVYKPRRQASGSQPLGPGEISACGSSLCLEQPENTDRPPAQCRRPSTCPPCLRGSSPFLCPSSPQVDSDASCLSVLPGRWP